MQSTRAKGFKYEAVAIKHLYNKGCEVVARNYYCKDGEIDIVAIDPKGQLVFIEVKARKSEEYGGGESAFTGIKKSKLKKSVISYLCKHEINHDNYRGDLLVIFADYRKRKYFIRQYKSVF